ncbi:methyltransferase type 12 [Actinoplanes sp. OR16]|uniref:class I SAM-dependent methyltransferase n=1 Tax=Actinoplanes sp. OR16 TaxID=946334 RepID=UPI000F6BCCF1|nr:class I SAM-dependent methyltransferase [Actinoplanes sp. OR16]BBH69657.1 methyltransferase type 12 [Actinoplanes sp. OR16]
MTGFLGRLAADHVRAGDPTGWFEPLYASGATVPWDVPQASAHLRAHPLPPGDGRRALVVGCGPGRDAEHIAAAGYATTAFDISPTAIDLARSRHPSTAVDYVVADLLAPPPEWHQAFDLVLESNNIQALPRPIRAAAIAAVGSFVAPGGTLLVLAAASVTGDPEGPPWPLTSAEMASFAVDGLRLLSLTQTAAPDSRLNTRWKATLTR